MMIGKFFFDLSSNPLFIGFTIIELTIFFYGVYCLYKSRKGTRNIIGLGERIKSFFEIHKGKDNISNEESIKFLNKSDNLTKTIIKLFTSSEQNEMGTDLASIEKVLRYEYEKPQSLVKTAYNILPVVGLIGTFLGISIAVYQLSFSSNISQIQETIINNLKSLNPFLDGIKLAFYTTILALILALGLRISIEIYSTQAKNAIVNFLNYFSIELSEYINPAGPAEKIAKSVAGFSKRVSRLSSNIESSLNKIVDNYSKNSESQARQFDEKIKRLDNIQDVILNNLKILWENISKTLNHTTEEITKATDNFTRINEQTSANSEQLGVVVGQISEINKSQIENTTKIGFAVRKLSEDNQKIIEQITKFTAPLDDLRLKYERVLSKSVELNEPFRQTNAQLKDNFEKLVQSINDLQIKNGVLIEKLNVYANSLESNLGTKLNNIVEAENQGQTMMKSLYEVQTNLSQSVENLNLYSKNLGDASLILVESIDNQLNTLFVDLSSRQNIAINVNNAGKDATPKIETIMEKQNETFIYFYKTLKNLSVTMDKISLSLIRPPFFSVRRWFGNDNHRIKIDQNEIIQPDIIKISEDKKVK